jgi:hypothetical protein
VISIGVSSVTRVFVQQKMSHRGAGVRGRALVATAGRVRGAVVVLGLADSVPGVGLAYWRSSPFPPLAAATPG